MMKRNQSRTEFLISEEQHLVERLQKVREELNICGPLTKSQELTQLEERAITIQTSITLTVLGIKKAKEIKTQAAAKIKQRERKVYNLRQHLKETEMLLAELNKAEDSESTDVKVGVEDGKNTTIQS